MAKDKRVKPSNRKGATVVTKKRFQWDGWKIGCLCLAVALVGTIVGFLVYMNSQRYKDYTEPHDLTTDLTATRTMLSEAVNYEGLWTQEEQGLVEVYLPGTELDTTATYYSFAVTAERDMEHDKRLDRSFGAMVDMDHRFGYDVDDDPMVIIDAVKDKIMADVAAVGWGYNPSGAYDIDIIPLSNGHSAILLEGQVTIFQVMQHGWKEMEDNPDQNEYYEESIDLELKAYITIHKGYPVVVWTVYDGFDYFATDECPGQLDQVLTTLWETKYLGDVTIWTPVATTIDEDGRVIFLDHPSGEDGWSDEDDLESSLPDYSGTTPQPGDADWSPSVSDAPAEEDTTESPTTEDTETNDVGDAG